MKKHKCIVKRRGHEEKFDERKIYSSCYAACLSASIEHMEAEKICDKVSTHIKKWAHKRHMMTSDEIFKETVTRLKKINSKASFMYETHRDIN